MSGAHRDGTMNASSLTGSLTSSLTSWTKPSTEKEQRCP